MEQKHVKHDPFGALKIAPFRQFITARSLLTISLQIQNVVLGWQVYALTHDTLSLAFLGLAEAIPAIAVAVPGGHIADTYHRKKVIVIITLILTLCSWLLVGLSIAETLLATPVVIGCIYSIVFISGLARGLMGPSIFALWPPLVSDPHTFKNAVTWNSNIWQISSTIGPIMGGLLLTTLQIKGTYVVEALLMLASSMFFFSLHYTHTVSSQKPTNFRAHVFDGIRFVFAKKELLSALTLDLFAVLFGGVTALLPVFATEILHVGTWEYGILKSAIGIGAILSATCIAFVPIRLFAGKIMLISVALFGICNMGFALSTHFVYSVLWLLMAGFFDGISVVIRATLTQTLTPNSMKGRVSAINNIFIGSSNEIGAFESGVAAKVMGLVPSVLFGGAMAVLVVLVIAWKSPKLRRLHL